MDKIIFFLLTACFTVYAACETCHTDFIHYTEYSCIACHNGNPDTSRLELAHYKINTGRYSKFLLDTTSGNKLIEINHCRRCHTIDIKGNSYASDLDISIKRLTPQEIIIALDEPNDQMPFFNLTSDDRNEVINALLRNSAFTESRSIIQVVHFTALDINDDGGASSIFEKQCGGCHRMLSAEGALGNTTLAPFITGLYSEFYPPRNIFLPHKDSLRWDREWLEKWLKNPRSVDKTAVMPAIELNEKDLTKIMSLFKAVP